MTERWLPVRGQEGRYEVSSLGRIRSLERWVPCKDTRLQGCMRRVKPRVLRASMGVRGFLIVNLRKPGRGHRSNVVYVHRAVAEAFFVRPVWGKKLRFKNLNRTDCRAKNLEWVRHNNGRETRRKNASLRQGYS